MARFAAVFAALFLQGCALTQSAPLIGTDELNKNIDRNAELLGDAYANGTADIILENILRARDRWPTSYTTVSGITVTPEIDLNTTGALTPIGLGNPDEPLGGSSLTIDQTTKSAASYSVNPFTSSSDGKSLFNPITDEIFQRYWSAGWPKDLLLMLLVDSIKISGVTYVNDLTKPTDFLTAIAPYVGAEKCRELLLVNGLSQSVCDSVVYSYEYSTLFDDKKCRLVETINRLKFIDDKNVGENGLLSQIVQLNELDGGNLLFDYASSRENFSIKLCGTFRKDAGYKIRPSLIKAGGAKTYRGVQKPIRFSGDANAPLASIKLRSIDSVIYYLGEWLRHYGDNEQVAALGAVRFLVTRPEECLKEKNDAEHPANRVFSVYGRNRLRSAFPRRNSQFAARAKHGNRVYYSVKRLEPESGGRREDTESTVSRCGIDRSGTVMALLVQLYLRSQASDFLKGPDINLLRTQ